MNTHMMIPIISMWKILYGWMDGHTGTYGYVYVYTYVLMYVQVYT